jgi:hypothetical protein
MDAYEESEIDRWFQAVDVRLGPRPRSLSPNDRDDWRVEAPAWARWTGERMEEHYLRQWDSFVMAWSSRGP